MITLVDIYQIVKNISYSALQWLYLFISLYVVLNYIRKSLLRWKQALSWFVKQSLVDGDVIVLLPGTHRCVLNFLNPNWWSWKFHWKTWSMTLNCVHWRRTNFLCVLHGQFGDEIELLWRYSVIAFQPFSLYISISFMKHELLIRLKYVICLRELVELFLRFFLFRFDDSIRNKI